MKNVAKFSVNGTEYVITRNRYLQAKYEELVEESSTLTKEEQKSYALLEEKYQRLEKLALRVKELEDKYYEYFNEEAGALYEKAKAQYDKLLNETVDFELKQNGIANKVKQSAINNSEQLLIASLQLDNNGNQIRTVEEATEIWCSYVDEVGKSSAVEWLLWFVNYITGNDKVEDDPFVAQAKAKAEQKENMKKGLKKVN